MPQYASKFQSCYRPIWCSQVGEKLQTEALLVEGFFWPILEAMFGQCWTHMVNVWSIALIYGVLCGTRFPLKRFLGRKGPHSPRGPLSKEILLGVVGYPKSRKEPSKPDTSTPLQGRLSEAYFKAFPGFIFFSPLAPGGEGVQ